MTYILVFTIVALVAVLGCAGVVLVRVHDKNNSLSVTTKRLQKLLEIESKDCDYFYAEYSKQRDIANNLYDEVRRVRAENEKHLSDLGHYRLSDSMEYGAEWPAILPPNWYGVKQFFPANTKPICTEYYLPLEPDASANKGKRVVLNRWPDCWWARIEGDPGLQKQFREYFSYKYSGDQTKTWKRGLTAIADIEQWLVETATPFYPRQVEEENEIPA